jgi:signal peptidase I
VALTVVTTLFGIGAVSLVLWPIGVLTITLMVLVLLIAYAVLIVDSIMVARRFGREYRLKFYNRWYVYLLIFVVVVTLGEVIKSGVRAYLVRAYHVPANSMAPTLLIGDHISADKLVYRSRSPKRFEVVVFKSLKIHKKRWLNG